MPESPETMKKAEKEIGKNIPDEMKGIDSEDYHRGDEDDGGSPSEKSASRIS